MNEHLESCDECLESYLSTLEEPAVLAPVPIPGIQPTRRPLNVNRNSTGRIRWASVALLLVFLAILMGFTPQGQVVLAQIRTTLENFGNSLTELFGLPVDSPYVKDVGQIQTITEDDRLVEWNAADIDIKLDQVMLEKNSLSYSILVGGNLPMDVTRVRFYEAIEINGERPFQSGSGSSEVVSTDGPIVMYHMTFNSDQDLPDTDNIHIKITLYRMDITTQTKTERVEGPWVFEFDMDGSTLTADTQIYQLSNEFDVNNIHYKPDKLVFSPVRQRLYVRKERIADAAGATFVPVSESRGNLVGFILTTDDGTEIELMYKNAETDDMGVYLLFETDKNQYEALNQSKTWYLIPYIARKDWKPTLPGVKGYAPFEEAAFTIDRNLPEQ